MVASVSLTIRIGIMVIIFMGVYLAINAYVDNAKKTECSVKLQGIAEYVESKIQYGLKGLNEYESNVTQHLHLPAMGFDYSVGIGCQEYLMINASSRTADRKYIIYEDVNCSRIQASGLVYPGDRCLIIKKIGETDIDLSLVSDCGFV